MNRQIGISQAGLWFANQHFIILLTLSRHIIIPKILPLLSLHALAPYLDNPLSGQNGPYLYKISKIFVKIREFEHYSGVIIVVVLFPTDKTNF